MDMELPVIWYGKVLEQPGIKLRGGIVGHRSFLEPLF